MRNTFLAGYGRTLPGQDRAEICEYVLKYRATKAGIKLCNIIVITRTKMSWDKKYWCTNNNNVVQSDPCLKKVVCVRWSETKNVKVWRFIRVNKVEQLNKIAKFHFHTMYQTTMIMIISSQFF